MEHRAEPSPVCTCGKKSWRCRQTEVSSGKFAVAGNRGQQAGCVPVREVKVRLRRRKGRSGAVELVTVREAARRLNRPMESVRKVIDARRIEKHYASGKQRFRIFWEDVECVYLEIQAAGR
jgi:hypothetical protein